MGNSNIKHEEEIELTSSNNSQRLQIDFDDKHIDKLTLIWLDANAQEYSPDSLHTKALIQEISNHNCLFFDQSDQFLMEINKMKDENRNLLVVMSGSYANEILSSRQNTIGKIIIFSRNYYKYAGLKNEYSNVVDICTENETLKNCINRQFPSLKFNLFINQIFNSGRILSSLQGVDNDSDYFSYILFIEVLKQIRQTEESKEIMLNKCKDYCRDNHSFLRDIEQFRNSYTSKKAIDWYIKDSFVFRLINQAFRTEDVMLWYLFRFYIIDLCKQLETIYKEQKHQTSFTVYCGQSMMSTTELKNLQSNIGCQILTNGFLSTSKDINRAKELIFGAVNTEEFKVVLFEIIVNASNLTNVVYVDIDEYTRKSDESEILFNIGTVFKIESIIYDSQLEMGVWRIKMEPTEEKIDEMKERIDEAKKKYLNGDINLLFGRLLLDMNQYIKAESYFQMLLQVLPRSNKDLAVVYDHIGDLNMRKTNYNKALTNFNLAYEIKQKYLCSNQPEIGVTLNSIGNYYKAIQNNVQALKFYIKALQSKPGRFNMALTQLNISTIHMMNKDYGKALILCIEARDTLQQINPCPYAQIIYSHGIIGDIYLAQEQYSIAEGYYVTALQMSEKFMTIGDSYQTYCFKALADLYNKQGNNQQAIDFCLSKLSSCEKHLPLNHMAIAYLSLKIGELYGDNDDRKISSLERALNILEKNIHFEYVTIASCLIMIAQYYQKQNVNENASKYYNRAIEIQKKIYPENHSIIIETQHLIDETQNQT
jgi:tetratricopeptide (TPR) repeat protein